MTRCRNTTQYELISRYVHTGETIDVPERATEPVIHPTVRPDVVRVTYLQELVDLPVTSADDTPAAPDRYIR